MSSFLEVLPSLLLPTVVGCIWGLSTPLLREGSKGVSAVNRREHDTRGKDHPNNDNTNIIGNLGTQVGNTFREVSFLLFRWQYIVPFLMNQGASIAYLYCLSLHDLSIIVPLVNCLNFICTFLGDVVIGNTTLSFQSCTGIFLILTGLLLCTGMQE